MDFFTIPFNRPCITGDEKKYIDEAVASGHLSGNGPMTARCRRFLETGMGYNNTLLTTSCTDALEMAAMLAGIGPGDEVIVPSYTFVSAALAFARQGADIVFADSRPDNPCIDENAIAKLITPATRAIVPVHYAGVACNMDVIMKLADEHDLRVIEDAAHAFGARYKGRLLGTIGHLGCFSFHETKIIHCGEGGMLSVNDGNYAARAEVIWEKGTNRCSFSRGEVSKYEWIDTGSSFLMSDINAAFLYPQLLAFREIYQRKKEQWDCYMRLLGKGEEEGRYRLPFVPDWAEPNYSGFYLLFSTAVTRNGIRDFLNRRGIQAVTHYLDLAGSPYVRAGKTRSEQVPTENSIRYQDTLLRLPLFDSLTLSQVENICREVNAFFEQ
ncbi:MAG: dTDP-4-amino-4,6-dideoxygalactose transaminase [Bacteroidales bacterium]|jgi:dTDP-4-amino-4,6-dideoxygalactose transaminase|nr:dTDP-4-amino-4,6-dideoxygalactose transaminase [Bacteroidales bacterium]